MSKTVSIAALCAGVLCLGLCACAWYFSARPGEKPEIGFLEIVGLGVGLVGLGIF